MGGGMSESNSSTPEGNQSLQHKELWLITKKEKSSAKESSLAGDYVIDSAINNSSHTSTPRMISTATTSGTANDGAMEEKFILSDGNGVVTSSKKISSLQELKEAILWLEQQEQSPSTSAKVVLDQQKRREATDDENLMDRRTTTKQFQPPTLSELNMNNHIINGNYCGNNNLSPRTSVAATTHAGTTCVFLDEVKRFELFRSVIQHEDDLLNQRVSWIILAQSFLMAAFITSSGSHSNDDGHGGFSSGGYSLKYITAVVGLLTVVVTMPAILAAGRNIELQQHVYFAHISSEERCRELHGHGRNLDDANRNRKEEYRERMRGGHIFPNMAFRGGGSVPIIYTVVALAVVQVLGWCFLLVALILDW